VMAFDIRSGTREFTALVLFSVAFALPILVELVGGDASATVLRAPELKEPASTSGGLRDRALDG
jgi:hypothetical protein